MLNELAPNDGSSQENLQATNDAAPPHGFEFDPVTIGVILAGLQLVFANNKYWVVQCKYGELIARLDFELIGWHVGDDERQVIEVSFERSFF